LHKVAEHHIELFSKDQNLGLVEQCIHSVHATNIKRHTQTYLTLSLQDIATSVKLPSVQDAQRAVLRMIEDEEVYATINQRDGMVSFAENPEHYDSNAMLSHLDSQVRSVTVIDKKLRSMDDQITLNPQYAQKLMGHDRHPHMGGGRFSELDEGIDTDRGYFPAMKYF